MDASEQTDELPFPTIPPVHHPPKMDALLITFLQIIIASTVNGQCGIQVLYCTSPKQQRRPLPSHLYKSFFYAILYSVQCTTDPGSIRRRLSPIISMRDIFNIKKRFIQYLLNTVVFTLVKMGRIREILPISKRWAKQIQYSFISAKL